MVIISALITFLSTLIGGLLALRYKGKLKLVLGFTAGVLLAVVAFDILPEVIELTAKTGVQAHKPMLALVLGFLIFHVLEKALLIHHAQEASYGKHRHPSVGLLSALALSGHSFLDGVGIGLGFQVSSAVGLLVVVAVVAHDFSDGMNTVSLMLVNKNTDRRALGLLLLDALTPTLGAASTFFFTLTEPALLLYLGFFAGFLLYIGASDILPEAHSEDSSWKTIAMTVLGVVFIFIVTRFV